jgi:N-acetylmuramoyl-L-alanine amidase
MRDIKSTNFSERSSTIIDTIVIHHTELKGLNPVVEIFTNPQRQTSSHYLILENGEIIRFVEENLKAHHAGISYWRGREKLNEYSIGIELDNLGTEPFSEPLIESLLGLLSQIQQRHNIDQRNVIGHYDIATNRKVDPNEFFPWQRLSQAGFGVYSNLYVDPQPLEVDTAILTAKLQTFGYKIDNSDIFTLELASKCFKKHYAIEAYNLTSMWDTLSELRLNDLLNSFS